MARNARLEKQVIAERLSRYGISMFDAHALRRIELTLHRWAELECGTDSGAIERDEKTGIPYWYNAKARYLAANDPRAYSRVPDREKGALERLASIMSRYPGLQAYHQTDPRGCALYIIRTADMTHGYSLEADYNRGAAVCA